MTMNLPAAFILVLLNILLLIWRTGHLHPTTSPTHTYTYLGDDFPLTYPFDFPPTPVALTLYESSHFALNTTPYLPSDSPVWHTAYLEWQSLQNNPLGVGRTQLGPQQRIFVPVFSHQMHCLRRLQVALQNPTDPLSPLPHVNHCLNYMRQTLMCNAADGLEAGDFLEQRSIRAYAEGEMSDTLVCRDWEAAYEELDKNHQRWLAWKEEWN